MPPAEGPGSRPAPRDVAAGLPAPRSSPRPAMSASARWILDGAAPSAGRAGRPWNACLRRAVPAAAGRFPPPQAAAGRRNRSASAVARRTIDFSVARAVLRYRDGGVARAAILLGKHGGHLGLLAPPGATPGRGGARAICRSATGMRWCRCRSTGPVAGGVGSTRPRCSPGRSVGATACRSERRLLRRVRATPPQHGDAGSRRRNVRDAFAVPRAERWRAGACSWWTMSSRPGRRPTPAPRCCAAAGAAAVGVLTLARVE